MTTEIFITRNETDADKEWTNYAIKNRHNITIYSHNNLSNQVFMKTLKGSTTDIQIIQHDQGYKNFLMKACNDLNVDYPNEKDCSYKRDYYLIRDADSLYFTGYFDINHKTRLQIKGRDAWLVEMFVNKILDSRKTEEKKTNTVTHNILLPVYMFSEDLKCWCQLKLNLKTFSWIYIMRSPKPKGKYLAFGSDPISYTARVELSMI